MGRSGRRHTREDLDFAGELALLAAPVVANARLLEQHRVARADAEVARSRLERVAAVGEALARSLDPEDTLRTIAEAVVPAIGDWCRIDLLDDHGVLQRRLAYHRDPARAKKALDMAKVMRASHETVGAIGWCIAHGRPHYGRFRQMPAIRDPALRLYTTTFGMDAHYILPLVARGRIIGEMAVIQAESARDLDEADRSLIHELGQRAALALDNARLYAEAEAARRQAEAANRAKDEFLAMLGHELRNPLAPISTALELMARRDSRAHVEERRIVARQVAHLSRLIDDLLDVSRITRGKIELQREPVDLRAVVANALEQTQPVFERRADPVTVELPPQPVFVDGDSVRLTQVVCNLLVNAAKYTPKDRRVSLFVRGFGEWGEVSVEDEGRGIPAQLLPHVFDLFVQGRQSLDRQAGGLGLGLAIVRTLVDLHGGSVSAESDGEGRGSRFTVRLPLTAQQPAEAEPTAPPAASPGGRQARVLIVDDNIDAAETLAELLRCEGYDVRCAAHGMGALAVLDSFDAQLALLDIGLPGIDGYELASRIRRRSGDGLKLVALTGYGSERDRARALQSRFDEHLVKPVNAQRLLGVLRTLLS